MSDGVAIAETWELRESLRNLLGHLISFSHLSSELFRRQRRLQILQVLWLREMGRDRSLRLRGRNLRLMLFRSAVILRPIAGRQRRHQAYDQCYRGKDSFFVSHNTFLINSTVGRKVTRPDSESNRTGRDKAILKRVCSPRGARPPIPAMKMVGLSLVTMRPKPPIAPRETEAQEEGFKVWVSGRRTCGRQS